MVSTAICFFKFQGGQRLRGESFRGVPPAPVTESRFITKKLQPKFNICYSAKELP